jgi:release factor glutamine methyltransferase
MQSQIPLTAQQENELFQTLLDKLSASWQELPDKPEESPENNLCALWFAATGKPKAVEFCTRSELPSLAGEDVTRLVEMVEENQKGVPLSHITGRQCFMGLEMLAGPEALIPRKETEILGYAALEKLRGLIKERGSVRVIDICTGSGNLALALAYYEPNCQVFGADLSSDALSLASRNAKHLELETRVQFLEGDLFAPFDTSAYSGQMDMITCNPPYISSSKVDLMPFEVFGFEPRDAFDGGPFGVSIILRLINEAPRFLKPSSWLGFEIGLGQGTSIFSRLERSENFREVQSFFDKQGSVRAIFGLTK